MPPLHCAAREEEGGGGSGLKIDPPISQLSRLAGYRETPFLYTVYTRRDGGSVPYAIFIVATSCDAP